MVGGGLYWSVGGPKVGYFSTLLLQRDFFEAFSMTSGFPNEVSAVGFLGWVVLWALQALILLARGLPKMDF